MTNQTVDAPLNPPAEAPVPAKKRPNTIGLIALILAGVGFVLAVIPPMAGFAWLLTLPALILGIIGLTRKGAKKGTSIVAIVLAAVAWLIAVFVALAFVATGISEAIEESEAAPPVTEVESAEGESISAVVGDTVTTDNGVSFTVSAVECGLATAGDEFFTEQASGQFCAVSFTLDNQSTEAVTFSSSSVAGYIGEAKYEAETVVGNFADEGVLFVNLNPGLAADGTVYFDSPTPLETVKFADSLFFGEEVVVNLQ